MAAVVSPLLTVRRKLVLLLSCPSLTVTVIAAVPACPAAGVSVTVRFAPVPHGDADRSEEHTSELQSLTNLVCRLLLEKKKSVPGGRARAHGPRGKKRDVVSVSL